MSATAFQRKRREAARLKEAAASNQEIELTVKQMKAILDEKGITYDVKAKKADLLALLDSIKASEEDGKEPPENLGEGEDENEGAE